MGALTGSTVRRLFRMFSLLRHSPRRVSVLQAELYKVQHRTMKIVPVPVRSDNYAYLLIDETSKTAAAVDPFDVTKVSAAAEEQGVSIVAAITTHHHQDHAGGNKVNTHCFDSLKAWRLTNVLGICTSQPLSVPGMNSVAASSGKEVS